jgi:hypothetical protein
MFHDHEDNDIRNPDLVYREQLIPSEENSIFISDDEKIAMQQSFSEYLEQIRLEHERKLIASFEKESLINYKKEMLSVMVHILQRIIHYSSDAKILYDNIIEFLENEETICILPTTIYEFLNEFISERYYTPLSKGRPSVFTEKMIEYIITNFTTL